jgi:hypothetical protein
MQYDGGGLDAGCEFNGLERVAFGQLAFPGALGRELVEVGSGQKLCTLEIRISPASTASRMPGTRLILVPWLSSAYAKPKSRISRSMARPSVCR